MNTLEPFNYHFCFSIPRWNTNHFTPKYKFLFYVEIKLYNIHSFCLLVKTWTSIFFPFFDEHQPFNIHICFLLSQTVPSFNIFHTVLIFIMYLDIFILHDSLPGQLLASITEGFNLTKSNQIKINRTPCPYYCSWYIYQIKYDSSTSVEWT